MNKKITDAYLPFPAEIRARRQESASIVTLETVFLDSEQQAHYVFEPGQFNMLYVHGIGEVAISISSDPAYKTHLSHTIRAVGRVTKALHGLAEGSYLGIRGPYGNGWPLREAREKDVLVLTGGLGCAPAVSIINYILSRQENFGKLTILQGVKHSEDFIFRQQYEHWRKAPNTEVFIAADTAGPHWPWSVGYVTDTIHSLKLNSAKTLVMMCGPEGMMHTAVAALKNKGISEEAIYLSMERNMACGIGHCGHCQYGGLFLCKDGPIFPYSRIKSLFSEAGF